MRDLRCAISLRSIPAVRPTFGELLEPTVDAKFILTPVLWKYLYRYARKHQARAMALVMAWWTLIPQRGADALCPLL
jgi:hypothetical protein